MCYQLYIKHIPFSFQGCFNTRFDDVSNGAKKKLDFNSPSKNEQTQGSLEIVLDESPGKQLELLPEEGFRTPVKSLKYQPSVTITKESLRTPVRYEVKGSKKKIFRPRIRKRQRAKKTKYRRFNATRFLDEAGEHLNRYLTEFCKMELMKKRKKQVQYPYFQKWLSANIYMSTSTSGYELMRKLLPLPSISTVKRLIRTFKIPVGVRSHNIKAMKAKLQPKTLHDKMCFILIDEMSVREGFTYDQCNDRIFGYEDDGSTRSSVPAKQALCVMATGLTKNWKYPIGFYFSKNCMNATKIVEILKSSIQLLEEEGFQVLGVTSDQGSNFERTFKLLGCSTSNPRITINGSTYFVMRDPPHLLKSARNMILGGDVNIPSFKNMKAKWTHIQHLFYLDKRRSLKLAPKISKNDVMKGRLVYGQKMKVKNACHVLSNTCSAALDFSIAIGDIESGAAATSTYCKLFNDLFDVFNGSTSKCKVPLRRPITANSKGMKFIQSKIITLKEIDDVNTHRRVKFIQGWIQNINCVKLLMKELKTYGVKYVAMRNICQDPLELLFSKIRRVNKYPDCKAFSDIYANIATGSLIRAPVGANCEETFGNCMNESQLIPELIPPESETVPDVEQEIEDIDSVLSTSNSMKIGGIFEHLGNMNSISYFCGYLIDKLDDLHMKYSKKNVNQCETCCNITTPCSSDIHIFTSFKEYTENGNPN